MTRIIAGSAGGRRLVVPAGTDTRPTSDRAREGLFSTLASLVGPLAGVRVLDLYAGSGALGLEALSRGAGAATFVESDPAALRALRSNVATLGLAGATVVADRVERWIRRQTESQNAGPAYDVVLADPPYQYSGDRLAEQLTALHHARLLGAGPRDAIAAVERSSRDPAFGWPSGWSPLRARRYGEATLWYGRPAAINGGSGAPTCHLPGVVRPGDLRPPRHH